MTAGIIFEFGAIEGGKGLATNLTHIILIGFQNTSIAGTFIRLRCGHIQFDHIVGRTLGFSADYRLVLLHNHFTYRNTSEFGTLILLDIVLGIARFLQILFRGGDKFGFGNLIAIIANDNLFVEPIGGDQWKFISIQELTRVEKKKVRVTYVEVNMLDILRCFFSVIFIFIFGGHSGTGQVMTSAAIQKIFFLFFFCGKEKFLFFFFLFSIRNLLSFLCIMGRCVTTNLSWQVSSSSS